MTRNMPLKEAFEYLYRQSQDTDFEKTLAKYRFNEAKIEESKRRLSRIDVTLLNRTKLGECMSWKTNISMRHKNESSKERSKLNLKNHPRKKLHEIVDKLHISNFIYETPNPDKPYARKGCHKRKNSNPIFLSRNTRKVKALLHLPLCKEKENTCTPRKNEKFLCRSAKKAKFSGSHNSKMRNTNSNVAPFDSGFYEIIKDTDDEDDNNDDNEDYNRDDNDESLTKLSQKTKSTSCVVKHDLKKMTGKQCLEKPKPFVVKSTASNESSAMNGTLINSSKETQICILPDQSSDGDKEKPDKSKKIVENRKSKEIVFKPLFAKHCGGTWRQIVNEN